MAGARSEKDSTAFPRVAAQLSRCFRTGLVPAEVADPLRHSFPEALLLSVSVPSMGLEDELLISLGNCLETGFSKVTLCALKTSAAGRCYTSSTQLDSSDTAELSYDADRSSDAHSAREQCTLELLHCSPIPLSTASLLAGSAGTSAASRPQAGCLGTLTLGLRGVSSSIARYKEDLHMLALLLAETIQRDSRGLVIDVCRYQLGGHGPWPEEEPLSSLDLSTSCSEEGGRYSSSSGGPPSGGLPQLITDPGDGEGPGNDGADAGRKNHEDKHRPQHGVGKGNQGKEVYGKNAKSAFEAPMSEVGPAAMRGLSLQGKGNLSKIISQAGNADGELQTARSADLQLRADMIETYDAKAAGCIASAFESESRSSSSSSTAPSSVSIQHTIAPNKAEIVSSTASACEGMNAGSEDHLSSSSRAVRSDKHQESCKGQTSKSSLRDNFSEISGKDLSSDKSKDSSSVQKRVSFQLSRDLSGNGKLGSSQEAGLCEEESAADKLDIKKTKAHSLERVALMAYKDPGTERAYMLWHARKRRQMDVAAFLVMVFLSASFAGVFSDEARPSWQSVALASWQHVLPLLIMAFCMPWYIRHRELVLGMYLVLSAAVTAYSSHRETLELHSQSAVTSLIWFSRAQSAEALMLKGIIFALRFRMVVIVQALCVIVAASNAAHVCSVCCSTFMSPTFCLLKAWATQAVFGCGVPAAVFYFTEDAFRQVFEAQHLQAA